MSRLPDLVVLLTVLLLFGTMLNVGRARGKYGIKAPATSGHPLFERAWRIQMNTLEGTVMFLPALWLAAGHGFAAPAGVAGLFWVAARLGYWAAYSRDPAKRGPAFGLGMLAFFAVLGMAAFGVLRDLAGA